MINSIILSGLPLSGKTTLAKKLGEMYHWHIYAIGQLWRDQWKEQYPKGEVSFEEFWRGVPLKDQQKINVKAREIFKAGNVIGDSRYSIYCKDLPSLLVFVTADLKIRAQRAHLKYPGKSMEDIEHILQGRENDELTVGKQLYGNNFDYRDSAHYHLSLNSGMLSVEEEVAAIEKVITLHGMRK